MASTKNYTIPAAEGCYYSVGTLTAEVVIHGGDFDLHSSVACRGSFTTIAEAQAWARRRVPGQRYQVLYQVPSYPASVMIGWRLA